MKRFPNVSAISPSAFERQVKAWLEAGSRGLEAFSATHREIVPGSDGEYEIDVVARFAALHGAAFVVLVECKKHKDPIKREALQVLREKQLSVGAHKCILASTSAFQSGAKEYAQQHGIALIQVVSGALAYIQAHAVRQAPEIPATAEDYAGLFYSPSPGLVMQPFTSQKPYGLSSFLVAQ